MPTISSRWDNFFLQSALVCARQSKDPSTKVGAVVCGPDREGPITSGFNGLPRGVEDTPQRLNNREVKYKLVVHAEQNALLLAARRGISLLGCTLYYAAIEVESGNLIWGGAPCIHCTTSIIQAGIVELVTYKAPIIQRWAEDMDLAREVLAEAGIKLRIVEL